MHFVAKNTFMESVMFHNVIYDICSSKKHDFDSITEQQLNEVEEKLNNIPRKRLGFLSLKTVFLSKIKNIASLT